MNLPGHPKPLCESGLWAERLSGVVDGGLGRLLRQIRACCCCFVYVAARWLCDPPDNPERSRNDTRSAPFCSHVLPTHYSVVAATQSGGGGSSAALSGCMSSSVIGPKCWRSLMPRHVLARGNHPWCAVLTSVCVWWSVHVTHFNASPHRVWGLTHTGTSAEI